MSTTFTFEDRTSTTSTTATHQSTVRPARSCKLRLQFLKKSTHKCDRTHHMEMNGKKRLYLGGRFNGGAVSQQQFNHFDVILLTSNMKRREAILINTASIISVGCHATKPQSHMHTAFLFSHCRREVHCSHCNINSVYRLGKNTTVLKVRSV